MGNECLFCELQKEDNKYKGRVSATMLYRDDDFYIKPGKGALIPGYLMIVPNEHILSSANLSKGKQIKLFKLLGRMKGILEDAFSKPVMYFESGTPDGGTKFSNSIIHAHIHSAPIDISEENDLEMKQKMFLEPFDYRNQLSELAHKGYSLLIDSKDNGFAATSLERPRQVFRKIIAKQIGNEDAWNWREDENRLEEHMIHTVEVLQPRLAELNKANFYLEAR